MRISSDITEPWSQFSDVLEATAFEVKAWSPAGFFSLEGNRGLETKVPKRGPGMEPQWGSGGEPPEADDRL